MWYKIAEHTVDIAVYVKPNAKKSDFVSMNENEIHIAVHAKPQDGEANKELIIFLSKLLSIPKSQIKLIRGETSRHKIISVPKQNSTLNFIKNIAAYLKDAN